MFILFLFLLSCCSLYSGDLVNPCTGPRHRSIDCSKHAHYEDVKHFLNALKYQPATTVAEIYVNENIDKRVNLLNEQLQNPNFNFVEGALRSIRDNRQFLCIPNTNKEKFFNTKIMELEKRYHSISYYSPEQHLNDLLNLLNYLRYHGKVGTCERLANNIIDDYSNQLRVTFENTDGRSFFTKALPTIWNARYDAETGSTGNLIIPKDKRIPFYTQIRVIDERRKAALRNLEKQNLFEPSQTTRERSAL